jgi:hypothetical protein
VIWDGDTIAIVNSVVRARADHSLRKHDAIVLLGTFTQRGNRHTSDIGGGYVVAVVNDLEEGLSQVRIVARTNSDLGERVGQLWLRDPRLSIDLHLSRDTSGIGGR